MYCPYSSPDFIAPRELTDVIGRAESQRLNGHGRLASAGSDEARAVAQRHDAARRAGSDDREIDGLSGLEFAGRQEICSVQGNKGASSSSCRDPALGTIGASRIIARMHDLGA